MKVGVMKQLITLNINGERHELALSPDTTLLNVLRDELGMLGTKRGCDTSACGCCTVHLDGKAVYACVVYAAAAQDCEITTIEGQPIRLSQYRGKAVLVNFWATWCYPCVEEMPLLQQRYLLNQPDLVIIAIEDNSPNDEIKEIIMGILL